MAHEDDLVSWSPIGPPHFAARRYWPYNENIPRIVMKGRLMRDGPAMSN